MTHDCAKHAAGPTCYQKCKCRCADCKRAQSRYAKHRRVKLAQGINDLVDATPAREHVRKLMRLGMSHGTIALQAGMPNSGLQSLLGLRSNSKQAKRIHRRTAARILAVTYTPAVGANFVASTSTRRRLQDLGLRGFSAQEIAVLSGIQKHTITEVRSGIRPLVRTATAEVVERLHKSLEGQEPTLTSWRGQSALAAMAKRQKYAPLAAWDDIDSEKEKPKGIAS